MLCISDWIHFFISSEFNYKKTFVNIVGQLINEPLRLEDMGKNALEATGYAQLRADEAGEYLLSILKNKWNNYVFYT